MQTAQRSPAIVREMALAYGFTALVTVLVSYTGSRLTRDYGHLLLAATFLGTALYCARRSGRPTRAFALDLSGLLEAPLDEAGEPEPLAVTLRRAVPRFFSELGVALACAALVFPPFALVFKLWHQPAQPFTLHLPDRSADFLLGQLLVVALPEEALFRGYFQTRLGELFPRRVRILGADVSPPALLCQALLFALLHFAVGLSPARLSVFFPALLFGWLRDLRHGIGAAIFFHALSNLLSELLTRGYF